MKEAVDLQMAPSLCPARRVYLERLEEMLAKSLCEGEKAGYQEHTEQQLTRLGEAAVSINCPKLEKALPALDEPVPPFATAGRTEFARQCPAFAALQQHT